MKVQCTYETLLGVSRLDFLLLLSTIRPTAYGHYLKWIWKHSVLWCLRDPKWTLAQPNVYSFDFFASCSGVIGPPDCGVHLCFAPNSPHYCSSLDFLLVKSLLPPLPLSQHFSFSFLLVGFDRPYFLDHSYFLSSNLRSTKEAFIQLPKQDDLPRFRPHRNPPEPCLLHFGNRTKSVEKWSGVGIPCAHSLPSLLQITHQIWLPNFHC